MPRAGCLLISVEEPCVISKQGSPHSLSCGGPRTQPTSVLHRGPGSPLLLSVEQPPSQSCWLRHSRGKGSGRSISQMRKQAQEAGTTQVCVFPGPLQLCTLPSPGRDPGGLRDPGTFCSDLLALAVMPAQQDTKVTRLPYSVTRGRSPMPRGSHWASLVFLCFVAWRGPQTPQVSSGDRASCHFTFLSAAAPLRTLCPQPL